MAALNKVMLIGNLGGDPEVRYLPNGDAVANVSLATTERWKKDGEQHEHTEWHKISFFGKLAELAGEYLKKGSPVYVEGKLRTRKWQDKEGNDRYTTEIVAERMQFLGSKPEGARASAQDYARESGRSSRASDKPQQQASGGKRNGGFDEMEDDIPF